MNDPTFKKKINKKKACAFDTHSYVVDTLIDSSKVKRQNKTPQGKGLVVTVSCPRNFVWPNWDTRDK